MLGAVERRTRRTVNLMKLSESLRRVSRLSEMQRYSGTGLISVQKKEKNERVSAFANEIHIAKTTRQVATTRTLGSHANGTCGCLRLKS